MQIEALKTRSQNNDRTINKTLKGVLVNNHIPNNEISFDEINDSLLIYESKNNLKENLSNDKQQENSFDVKKAIKPLLIGTSVMAAGAFILSSILKKSSKNLVKSKSFEQLPDIALNMNIKEEPHFALYRAIRDPNFKNIMAATMVFIMSGITIACKNFVDGAKEIWLKKQSADIEKNLQENLIEVETNSFSGKLNFVNELMSKNVKYFDEVIKSRSNKSTVPNIFKGFPAFKGNKNPSDNKEKNRDTYQNIKYGLMAIGVILGAILLGKFSISNIKKTTQYTQEYANNFAEKTIDTIKNISEKGDKKDIPAITELLKSICAKPEFIKETGAKYNLGQNEIQNIIDAVEKSKKTIFADAPTALGGIPKKIQYYCYLDENRGHLYNWVLNPDNKFTKYIFSAFTISSAIGYLFKQTMDALKEATVMKENAKTELNLRKRLVDVEISNFKSKKESAIQPLIDNFVKQANEGKKTKEELKQIADNILTETKNGPPYVYT